MHNSTVISLSNEFADNREIFTACYAVLFIAASASLSIVTPVRLFVVDGIHGIPHCHRTTGLVIRYALNPILAVFGH